MKNILLTTFAAITMGLTQNAFAQMDSSPSGDSTTRNTRTEGSNSGVSPGGLFVEPMLIMSQEDTSIKTSELPIVNQDTSGDSRGYGFGLRLGGHISEVILLAVDGRYSRENTKDSFYGEADSSVYNVAPMVGVQTPLLGIRLMAGYVVAGENDPETGANGLNLKFKEASGWRVGAGIHFAAVGINLEYQDLTYNTTEIESVGSLAVNNSTTVDANSRGYSLSLSFPIEL